LDLAVDARQKLAIERVKAIDSPLRKGREGGREGGRVNEDKR